MFKNYGPFRVVSFAEFDINLAVSRNHIKLLSVVALEMLIPHYVLSTLITGNFFFGVPACFWLSSYRTLWVDVNELAPLFSGLARTSAAPLANIIYNSIYIV